MSGPAEPVKVDEIKDIWSFLTSIDWTENWFKLLLMFHATFLFLSVVTRNHATIQAVLFVILLLGVYSAESVNEWAAKNWRSFASQQYFDSGGLFISIVFSTPALFNCLIMVVIWLWNSALLMSDLRQIKMQKHHQHQPRQRQRANKWKLLLTQKKTRKTSDSHSDLVYFRLT